MKKVRICHHIFEKKKKLHDRVSCEIFVIMMCCSTIRVSDLRPLSDKSSVFVMIDLLHHLTYHIQKSSNNLIFTWETFVALFHFPTRQIILFSITSIFHPQHISHFVFLSFCSERKSSPMYMIDGTVPQLNSIRTRPWFVFLSNCDVVDVIFLFFLLTDEILISHSLLKVFRTKSAYVLNIRLQIRDVIKVNYFLQSTELTFCPEQKVFEHMSQLESPPY